MQIRAIRGAHGDYGSVKRGQIVDVPDSKAQQLVRRGLFVPVQGKEAAKSAPPRPSAEAGKSQDGGRTGGAKPLLSSREARQPKPLTSRTSEDGVA